jgi:phage baseplate assembly protein gpV
LALRGVVLEGGKQVTPGKFTVGVMRQRGSDGNGPLDQVPGMATPGLDGSFAVAALQPGKYRVMTIKALDALRSPGSVFTLAQDMYLDSRNESAEVEIVSGQTAEVTIEAGEPPIEGPTAQLMGSVTVDGKLAAGYSVTAYGQRRFGARVDERGRFDLGIVPAGDLWVQVTGSTEGVFMGPGNNLWSQKVTLAPAELRDLTIEVVTSSMRGTCWLSDGSPAAGAYVHARGKLKSGGDNAQVWLSASVDAQGAFRFPQVPEGTWSLEARGGTSEAPGKGLLEGIIVVGGVPNDALRIELAAPLIVKGRVDLAVLAERKAKWAWINFYRLADSDGPDAQGEHVDGCGIDMPSGKFRSEDLKPGRYRVTMGANLEGQEEYVEFTCDPVVITANASAEVVVTPRPEIKNRKIKN